MKELSVLVPACNLSIQGAQEQEIPQVQSQPESHSFKPPRVTQCISNTQTHTHLTGENRSFGLPQRILPRRL